MTGKKTIKELMRLIEFPAEAADYFEEIHRQILQDPETEKILAEAADTYFETKEYEVSMALLSEKAGIHRYSADMMLLLICACRLWEIYKEKNYPEELFRDTMMDLNYKLKECRDVYGVWGTFVLFWDDRFFDCTRFKLGRLQYETEPAKCDYKDLVKKGDPVLNCHIPSAGPLTPELVRESLQKAYEFYGKEGDMVVVCDSWLLYPPLREVFPEGSNLRKFHDMFDVVESREEKENPDAWRVFSTAGSDIRSFPQNTSLQKRLYEYLKAGKAMGEGYGFLIWQPEKKS